MAKNIKNIEYKSKKEKIVRYDMKSDVLYFGLKKGMEEEFVEVAPGVSVEFDKKGEAIGIEIINASKILKPVSKNLEMNFIKPQEVFIR